MLKTDAQLAQEQAVKALAELKEPLGLGLIDQTLYDLLEIRLKGIYKLIDPYVKQENRDDLIPFAEHEDEDSGLSGDEDAAFNRMKTEDTLGQDPEVSIG